jgi:hypothetical protein
MGRRSSTYASQLCAKMLGSSGGIYIPSSLSALELIRSKFRMVLLACGFLGNTKWDVEESSFSSTSSYVYLLLIPFTGKRKAKLKNEGEKNFQKS